MMRKAISFLVAVALVGLPIQVVLRRSEQRKMLNHLKEIGWGMGETEKLCNFYFPHGLGHA